MRTRIKNSSSRYNYWWNTLKIIVNVFIIFLMVKIYEDNFDQNGPLYCHHKAMNILENCIFEATMAESPSGRFPQMIHDLNKRTSNGDTPAKGPFLRFFQMNKSSKTWPRTILHAPSAEGDWKKPKLAKRIESLAEPSTPPKQEEILSQSGLQNPLVLYLYAVTY